MRHRADILGGVVLALVAGVAALLIALVLIEFAGDCLGDGCDGVAIAGAVLSIPPFAAAAAAANAGIRRARGRPAPLRVLGPAALGLFVLWSLLVFPWALFYALVAAAVGGVLALSARRRRREEPRR